MSLRRAFRIAGAETVLASHWKVSDQATGRLMSGFMRRWAHLKSNGESEPARPRWECARFIGVLPLQLAPLWSWPPSRSTRTPQWEWGAHAARVLVWAARPNPRCTLWLAFRRKEVCGGGVFGEPPKTTRQRRVLPHPPHLGRSRLRRSGSRAHANAVLWALLRPVSGASGAALKAIFLLEL